MSLHFLIDGYNIIQQIPLLAQKALEDGRQGLINLIEDYRPQGSLNNSVTIIFDGKAGMYGDIHQSGFVKVIFAIGESADDKIIQLVSESKNSKQVVVVTDDRDIQYHIRALGAKVLKVKEFIGKVRPFKESVGRKNIQGTRKDSTKLIPKTLEHEITSEFERIWLGKKNKDH